MEWLLSVSSRVLPAPGVLVPLLLAALLCAVAVPLTSLYQRRWLRAFRHAAHDMRGGWAEHAEERFRRVARWSYGTRRTAALAGVAFCRMCQAEYAEAVALLEPLMARRLPRSMPMDAVALPGQLALGLAMLGDTRRAKYWFAEACERFGGLVTFLVLPEVAILCREGRVGAALKRLEDCWPMLVADGAVCPRLRLFRAFAQRLVDPERDADRVILTLLSLAPFPPKELAFCREHWPVLADFMQEGEELAARREAERVRSQAEWERRWAERERASAPEGTAKPGDPATPRDDTSR
jgi:hypothetical protein